MTDEEFTRYVQDNYGLWLRFVRPRMRGPADDVVQAMVLRLCAMRTNIDPKTVDGLAFLLLRHEVINEWRRRSARTEREQEVSRPEAGGESPGELAGAKEQADALRGRVAEAKGLLTPRQRSAFAVWLIAHPPREQAARLLGLTESAYSALVHQGLKRLTDALIPRRERLVRATADLGYLRAFDVLAEAFREDLPEGMRGGES